MIGERRTVEAQRSIDAYTTRILGVVAHLGYGIEYLAAARLHRVGELPDVTPDWFYRNVQHLPFCVTGAAQLMDEVRYAPIRNKLSEIAMDPIARVVTYCEAVANSGGQLEGAPGDTMNEARVQFLTRCLEPLLPQVDAPV